MLLSVRSDQKMQVIVASAKENINPQLSSLNQQTLDIFLRQKETNQRARGPPIKLLRTCHVESSSPETVSSSLALSSRLFIDCSKDGSDQMSGVRCFIRGGKMTNPKCQYVNGASECAC